MEHLYPQNLIGKYIDYYGLVMKKIVTMKNDTERQRLVAVINDVLEYASCVFFLSTNWAITQLIANLSTVWLRLLSPLGRTKFDRAMETAPPTVHWNVALWRAN